MANQKTRKQNETTTQTATLTARKKSTVQKKSVAVGTGKHAVLKKNLKAPDETARVKGSPSSTTGAKKAGKEVAVTQGKAKKADGKSTKAQASSSKPPVFERTSASVAIKAGASKTASKSKPFSTLEKRVQAAEEHPETIFNSATEVAKSLRTKAREAVGVVEKAVEKVSGKATQALRSVEAALEARKISSPRKIEESHEIENIAMRINGSAVTEGDAREEEPEDDSSEAGEAKTKAKKLQVFRSRAERLKVERLISDTHQPVQKRWAAIYDQLKHLKASAYDMTGQFDLKTPVIHKVLGWGFIIDIRDSRMDVMFKDGLKTLIMNYRR